MKLCAFLLLVGLCVTGYAVSLPPVTSETFDTKVKFAAGGIFIAFLALARMIGGADK